MNRKKQVSLTSNRNYFNLIRELAVTEFKLKYHGSVLGYFWSFTKPLMLFSVLYLVFTHVLKVGHNIPHYPLYLLVGIVMWSYFADATLAAMSSIVDRQDLIRKVYFPRWVILIGSSLSSLITFALNMIVVIVFLFIFHDSPHFSALAILLLIAELYFLVLGFSLLLSSLYVKFRDIKHIWEVILQVLFYATPIIYPLSLVPKRFQGIVCLSPITQILQDARSVLITPITITPHEVLKFPYYLLPFILLIIVLTLGYFYFKSAAAQFAEEV